MALAKSLRVEDIRAQIAALDSYLNTLSELKAQLIATQTGVPLKDVQQALDNGARASLEQSPSFTQKRGIVSQQSCARSRSE
jgi:hypothetical protein